MLLYDGSSEWVYMYVLSEWVTGRIRWVSELVIILGAWIELLSEWLSGVFVWWVVMVCSVV